MNKEDVKAWAVVATAVLTTVYTLEKVIDRGIALATRIKFAKRHAATLTESNSAVKGIVS